MDFVSVGDETADGCSGAGADHHLSSECRDVGEGSIFRHRAFTATAARPTGANCAGDKRCFRTFVRCVPSGSSLRRIGEQWTIGYFPATTATTHGRSFRRRPFITPTRNYFTGVLVPGYSTQPGPFYNAAEYARSGGTVTLFSQTNGQVVLYDKGVPRIITGTRDWGSDIVSIHSTCGEGSLLLVSAAGAAPTDSVTSVRNSRKGSDPGERPDAFGGFGDGNVASQ